MPFDVALDRVLPSLADADSRLAHELAAGVLRNEQSLDRRLDPRVKRGIARTDMAIREILRLAVYQIEHLDRVPPHAAVTTAVSLARQVGGERQAAFVNAVLRRVADDIAEITPDSAPDPVADRGSHPRWLVERWSKRFGAPDTANLIDWNNSHPPLVVQSARWSAGELEQAFTAAGVNVFEAPFGAGLVVDTTRPVELPGYVEGAFHVQDPAQALVLRYADFPADAVVYDACAAPGGKAVGLSFRVATVIAGEMARRRIPRLASNLARAGSGRTAVMMADALHPPIRKIEAILLDAPCLGTGTFARHPDARLRASPAGLVRLAAQQAGLLDAAAARLNPGGVLCYSTCSLEPEENEMQIDAFLNRHPAFRRAPSDSVPGQLLTPAGDLVILPHRDGMDGAYAARLVRTGE